VLAKVEKKQEKMPQHGKGLGRGYTKRLSSKE
jgi:hypothetical protein